MAFDNLADDPRQGRRWLNVANWGARAIAIASRVREGRVSA